MVPLSVSYIVGLYLLNFVLLLQSLNSLCRTSILVDEQIELGFCCNLLYSKFYHSHSLGYAAVGLVYSSSVIYCQKLEFTAVGLVNIQVNCALNYAFISCACAEVEDACGVFMG